MRFWVGGTGNWDQSTTTHWSTSSGGSGGASIPTSSDDVIFDSNSGSGTVTVTTNAPCQSIQSTGTTLSTFVHNSSVTITIGGSGSPVNNIALDLSGFTTYTLGSVNSSGIVFASTTSTQLTINFSSFSCGPLTWSGIGGSWLLISNVVCSSTNSFCQHTHGILNTNGFNLTCLGFTSNSGSTRTLTLGTSTITLTGTSVTAYWNIASSGLTFSGASSTIVFSTTSANTRTFSGGGLTYGTLTYTVAGSTGALVITGSNTFTTINFSDSSNGRALQFTAGTTTTITNFNVNGTLGKLITVESVTSATHTLDFVGSTISCNYLDLIYSSAIGASAFAGTTSTDGGNNTGWIFSNSPIAPTVIDSAATSISYNSAVGNGNITSNGGATVTASGFVWGLTPNPTLSSNVGSVSNGAVSGSFNSVMSGLSPNTNYHYVAYATNSIGTSYGSDQSFTTSLASANDMMMMGI